MHSTWLVLLPPIIVLLSTFITKRLNPSLLMGLLVGALIAQDGVVINSFLFAVTQVFQQLIDPENIYLFAFSILTGILVALINRTGGAIAFAHLVTKRIHSIRVAETSSILLSFALLLDDYLSNLTVGHIMRPLTDRLHIPRAKLAYLVHSLSSPLVILVPISSWVGIITLQLSKADISPTVTATTKIIGEPFFIYLQTLPFIFYSLLTIASVWFIVHAKISFGPMHTHEVIARTEGTLFGNKKTLESAPPTTNMKHGSSIDLFVPLITLIVCVVLGVLYNGGYHLLGGTNTLLEAFQKSSNIFLILFLASAVTVVLGMILSLVRHTITLKELPSVSKEGFMLMYDALIMILLASTLSAILKNDLQTGNYIASLLPQGLSLSLFPVIMYLTATVTALLIGSAWGTIMLLVPLALQMLATLMPSGSIPAAADSVPLLFPILGAIFSGAVCGNHISPISDTTILSSTSSGCRPLDHAYTQFPYALPVIITSTLAFFMAGFLIAYGPLIAIVVPLSISLVLCLGILYGASHFHKKRFRSKL